MNVRRAVTTSLFALGLFACGSDDRPRCSECGMFADTAPQWAVGATDAEANAVRFDAPRCFFARKLRANDLREPWVTEYYTQARSRADRMAYVAGSDLTGPMGRDFVPVDPANVARFVTEHGGRSLPYEAIDARALRALDP